jgi:predicted NAD/FAD-binding protein
MSRETVREGGYHPARMRIGIIGGGAAGLTATWLLQDRHDVTLFEQQARFGGHAHTFELEQDGGRAPVAVGFEFFAHGMWPTFHRLLGSRSRDSGASA